MEKGLLSELIDWERRSGTVGGGQEQHLEATDTQNMLSGTSGKAVEYSVRGRDDVLIDFW